MSRMEVSGRGELLNPNLTLWTLPQTLPQPQDLSSFCPLTDFADEETEVQGGVEAGPKSQSELKADQLPCLPIQAYFHDLCSHHL